MKRLKNAAHSLWSSMTWKTRLLLRESAFTAFAFTGACYLYYQVTFWGVSDHFKDGPLKDYLSSNAAYVEILLGGILFGGLIGVINRIAESPRLRDMPFGKIVLLRTVLFLLSMSLVTGLICGVFLLLILSWEEIVMVASEVTTRHMWALGLWMIFVVGAINFSLEVRRVVGPGNLWRILIGRYRQPQEEHRIFLFMDLKGSTSAAEKLGHQKYSEMIQQCFQDLTQVVLQHEAAIYQYVGDEVVLSWPAAEEAEKQMSSVLTFFDYEQALLSKREEYIRRFGLMPEFRGGIDSGAVIVTEVGDVKREIVYHGDVLNTAARLLELCKKRGDKLVVSGSVGMAMQQEDEIVSSWHGKVPLRGKQRQVEAYSLQPA